jgi:hypothetical protein
VVWTPPVFSGGTPVSYTESLDRQARNMQLTALTQADQSGGTFSSSKMPSGGTVTINDTYSDTLGGIATQIGSGPTIPGGGGGTSGSTGAIYDMSADPTWPIVLDSFAAQNNLSGDPGTASVTWDLTPRLAAAKKSHQHKHHKHKPKHYKPKR